MGTQHKAEVPEAFRCDECGTVHGDEQDAYECCAPRVTEGYCCPLCDAFHHHEEEAIACCGFDPDAPPPPSAEALERAGHMRLLP